MPTTDPSATIVVREHHGRPFYEAKFRYRGRQVKRRIGPAWLDRDPASGEWRRRRGRVAPGAFDEPRAHVAAAQQVSRYAGDAAEQERIEHERLVRGVTFREVAEGYIRWLGDVHGAKPSTLRDYRYMLAREGHIMATLGERRAAKVSARDVEAVLSAVSATGASPRTVNKHRALVSAIYGYGMRSSTFGLPANPASGADKRREPHRGVLLFFTPEEIEALARTLEAGLHRDPSRRPVSDQEREARCAEDQQEAELVRLAAYTGLRQGELLALRWRDVDFAGSAITVARAISAGVETSTKSGRVRRVPLPDQAAAALDRLSRRRDFTAPDELVFCNALGRSLDSSALRRRFKRARDAAGLRPLRFHDLRHTYGSLLAAAGVDLVTIQAAMGHGALVTTGRYLHARPAADQAAVFTQAFQIAASVDELVAAEMNHDDSQA
jgi:integrase